MKTVYWVTAICVMALLGAVCFGTRPAARAKTAYPVVIMGDSLMGLCRDETSIASLMSVESGYPVLNGAFGGTCMALNDDEIASNYTMELLNMVSLSKAMAAKDFGAQQTVRSRREITDYFTDTVDELSEVDFDHVQVLILEFGLNDYHAGIALDNGADPCDEHTYGGALRSVLGMLKKEYPQMRVILVSPTYSWYLTNKLTCEEYVTGEAFLEEYVGKQGEIAKQYGVEFVDLYHGLYTHEEWSDWKLYTIDGLHPNEESRQRIAGILSEKISDALSDTGAEERK